jgi:hypothetical protein
LGSDQCPPGRPQGTERPASGPFANARLAEVSAGAAIRLGVDPRAEISARALAAGRTPLLGGQLKQ